MHLFAEANQGGNYLIWVPIIVFLVLLLGCLFAFASIGKIWLQAFMSHAGISLPEIIGMKLRKINANVIISCRIMSVQADCPVSVNQLQAAYLSGADVPLVTRAYIDAIDSGKEFTFDELVAASRSDQLKEMLNA